MAQRTYYIDHNGSPRYSDTHRFVRRDLLPALEEVDPPDAPAAPPPSPRPEFPAESQAPARREDAMPPAPHPPPSSIAEAAQAAAESAAEVGQGEQAAERPAEPESPGVPAPLFTEDEPAEPPTPAAASCEHHQLCPRASGRRVCGCGAEFTEVSEDEAAMYAAAAGQVVDLMAALAGHPLAPWAAMRDPRVARVTGIPPAKVAEMQAAEIKAWRLMAAKYGSVGGAYAVELGLAAALLTGAAARWQAARMLAAQAEAEAEAAAEAERGAL